MQNPNSNQRNISARNPHYENIYESIDQFATINAAVPAVQNAQLPNNNNINRINLRSRNNYYPNASTTSFSYPRNGAYDIPRQRTIYQSNAATTNRRANINLETNANRVRYLNSGRYRQRSFDDTESFHYSYDNNNMRYENIYEQIREEPIYPNVAMNSNRNRARNYGRLDVIGHGIGKINYHFVIFVWKHRSF